MKFNVIHNGKREKISNTQSSRTEKYNSSRSKKHTSVHNKQYQHSRQYKMSANAVSSASETWDHAEERSLGQTAVSEGDLSMSESLELKPVRTAVTKNNGLMEQSFIRRTALKIRKGIERVAHQRRRFNYARKVADERIRENLWKRIRMESSGRDQLKDNSLYDILGCDWNQFRGYIEQQFDGDMNWQNYGAWYIDFADKNFSEKWNYKNLVPRKKA